VNRRIFRLIMVMTALTLLGFGIPLGLVVRQLDHDQVMVRLVNEATRVALVVPSSGKISVHDLDHLQIRDAHQLAVYGRDGLRRSGTGPLHADPPVLDALRGQPERRSSGHSLTVAMPVVQSQQVRWVVRAATPTTQLNDRVHRSWLLMIGLATAILLLAAIAARLEARRLSKPVEELAVAVSRLGSGDFSVRTDRAGVPELDEAAKALDATAERLGVLVERERAFSANASHQLRTPLTGFRIELENALGDPTSDHREELADALGGVDRLETTIRDLIELARQPFSGRDEIQIGSLLEAQRAAWQVIAHSTDRELVIEVEPGLPLVECSEPAVRQILEVLVSNAFVHGAGTVTVAASQRVGGVAVDVTDEGPGITTPPDQLFADPFTSSEPASDQPPDPSSHRVHPRHATATGHGMGLPLAASLAVTAGGRLLLRNTGPHPRFTLLLLSRADD
jgi:signal transduction histidine kinase